jgi:hypothetical protein
VFNPAPGLVDRNDRRGAHQQWVGEAGVDRRDAGRRATSFACPPCGRALVELITFVEGQDDALPLRG